MADITDGPWPFRQYGGFTDDLMYKHLAAHLASAHRPPPSPPITTSTPLTGPSWTADENGTEWLDWLLDGLLYGNHTDSADTTRAPLPRTVAIVMAGTLLSILTTAGNLLVLASFKVERQLRTISNYFLFSLALADLTIGVISIPLMTLYTAEGVWTLGYTTCQFWLSIDYLMSNASVMNLLVISCDRYFSVTRPLTYRPRRTGKKAVLVICATFLTSLLLWPPLIIAWPHIEGAYEVSDDECVVQFLRTNTLLTLCTITVAFFGPVVIMIVLYSRVYYVTRTRQRELIKLQAFHQKSVRRSSDDAQSQSHHHQQRSRRRRRHSPPGQADLDGEEGSAAEGKPWGIQALLEHFTRARLTHGGLSRKTSLASSGFDEDETFSAASGENTAPEARPLRSSGRKSAGHSASDYGSTLAGQFVAHVRPSFLVKKGRRGQGPKKAAQTDPTPTESPIEPLRKTRRTVVRDPYAVQIELGRAGTGGPVVTLRKHASFLSPANEQRKERDAVRRLSSCSSAVSETTSAPPLIIANRAFPLDDNSSRLAISMTGIAGRLTSVRGQSNSSGRRRRGERRQQESKAARTLSAILLAFIITWTPYSLIVCIESFYPNYVPAAWFTAGYYLCYLNSTVNPFLYALCNATFRRTFWRIMTGKWKPVKPSHRASSHHHAAAAIAAVAVAAANRRHSNSALTTLQ